MFLSAQPYIPFKTKTLRVLLTTLFENNGKWYRPSHVVKDDRLENCSYACLTFPGHNIQVRKSETRHYDALQSRDSN
jgi:hypothetical protein